MPIEPGRPGSFGLRPKTPVPEDRGSIQDILQNLERRLAETRKPGFSRPPTPEATPPPPSPRPPPEPPGGLEERVATLKGEVIYLRKDHERRLEALSQRVAAAQEALPGVQERLQAVEAALATRAPPAEGGEAAAALKSELEMLKGALAVELPGLRGDLEALRSRPLPPSESGVPPGEFESLRRTVLESRWATRDDLEAGLQNMGQRASDVERRTEERLQGFLRAIEERAAPSSAPPSAETDALRRALGEMESRLVERILALETSTPAPSSPTSPPPGGNAGEETAKRIEALESRLAQAERGPTVLSGRLQALEERFTSGGEEGKLRIRLNQMEKGISTLADKLREMESRAAPPREAAPSPPVPPPEKRRGRPENRQRLEEEKENLEAILAMLQEQHEAGVISREAYEEARRESQRKLDDVLQRLAE
ncbi:MAG: hypothetical protein HY558_05620 [Euryarchaeota archaeon]|nr:hypothetical protein [Euryarchaeota archaeon]